MYFILPNRFQPWFSTQSRLHFRRVPATLCAVSLIAGCEHPQHNETQAIVSLVLEAPLEIPPHRAHAKFQGGCKVQGVSRYDPWCELETDEVSEQSHYVAPGHFRVKRIGQTLIRDYHARLPVLGFGCNELLFQETTLWMDRRTSPQVRYLRCFAPYANCRFGPPLSPRQIQAVLGPKLTLAPGRERDKVEPGGGRDPDRRTGTRAP